MLSMYMRGMKMNGQALLEQIINTYRANFDIEEPYEYHGKAYYAYAGFNLTSAKYVLVKRAELWRANCFEHVFFLHQDSFSVDDIQEFQQQLLGYMEPELVRGGEKLPPPNHMYTYLTGIFVSEKAVSKETAKALRKLRFRKNYRFAVRGYAEERVVIFDMENKKIMGNPAAKDLLKGYKKMLKSF